MDADWKHRAQQQQQRRVPFQPRQLQQQPMQRINSTNFCPPNPPPPPPPVKIHSEWDNFAIPNPVQQKMSSLQFRKPGNVTGVAVGQRSAPQALVRERIGVEHEGILNSAYFIPQGQTQNETQQQHSLSGGPGPIQIQMEGRKVVEVEDVSEVKMAMNVNEVLKSESANTVMIDDIPSQDSFEFFFKKQFRSPEERRKFSFQEYHMFFLCNALSNYY